MRGRAVRALVVAALAVASLAVACGGDDGDTGGGDDPFLADAQWRKEADKVVRSFSSQRDMYEQVDVKEAKLGDCRRRDRVTVDCKVVTTTTQGDDLEVTCENALRIRLRAGRVSSNLTQTDDCRQR